MNENAIPPTALAIRLPYASLIVAGIEDVENRSWTTKRRWPLTMHAAKAFDPTWRESPAADRIREFLADREPLPTGVIPGGVAVVDVVRDSPSPWAEPDAYHWVLADVAALHEPIPATGRLGLWRLNR